MRQKALRAQAATVLPSLRILALREDHIGRGLALDLGVRPGVIALTGDDALELIDDRSVSVGNALGFNVRVSGYAGVDSSLATAIGDLVLEAAGTLQAPIVGLPVSRYAVDADVAALRALFRSARNRPDIILDDIASPEELVSATAGCRAIVTGSYHTAVFGLALGVPTVCLTKSSYYQGKFGGLQSLFPHACFVVPLDESDCADRLGGAIFQAWHLPTQARVAARGTAARLRNAGREAYAHFRLEIENRTLVTTDNRGLAT
jgi:colanic acid/amylovoran biosynthesis protein